MSTITRYEKKLEIILWQVQFMGMDAVLTVNDLDHQRMHPRVHPWGAQSNTHPITFCYQIVGDLEQHSWWYHGV